MFFLLMFHRLPNIVILREVASSLLFAMTGSRIKKETLLRLFFLLLHSLFI
jgi:hypothetical protein